MNKVFSLKYSFISGGLIAVSELSRRCFKKSAPRRKLISGLLLATLYPGVILAGTVNSELDYQLFRDFAENKGQFVAGATNLTITDKNGNVTGLLDKAPMPDFSSVSSNGVATLINPQYVASVKHNGGYQGVIFGNSTSNPDNDHFNYKIVDRNNHTRLDFHAPRLNKIVTETAPSALTEQGQVAGAYKDTERYPVFYRLGTGTQYVKDKSGKLVRVGGAYSYLTGGTVPNPSSYQNGEMISAASGMVFDYASNGALPIYGESGDSGSPLFGWDTTLQKWVLVGVLTAGNGAGGRANNWAVMPLEFIKTTFDEDRDPTVTYDSANAGVLDWVFDSTTGIGNLTQGITKYDMHGQKGTDLNAGKNLEFSGQDGKINLVDDVHQGAGSLTFKNDFTVASESGKIWTGAGVIVDKDATVKWQINGQHNDALHKIGEGTLYVNGSGTNPGDLRVGDGTVILAQQADQNGNKQAFNKLTITSGRPTVVLKDAEQVNPDNIYFGYRGGRLDLNGNHLSFSRIKNADSGANIVNNNKEIASLLTINGKGMDDKNNFQTFLGILGETDSKRHNGVLNVSYAPVTGSGVLNLSGGSNLNGDINVQNGGTLLLSGNPVQHAGNVFIEGDWNKTQFNLNNINVASGSSLHVSEYAELNGNINVGDGAFVNLGYAERVTQRCKLDNNTGKTSCFHMTPENVVDSKASRVIATGDVTLNGGSLMHVGNASLTGGISGSPDSQLIMSSDAMINLDKNSSVGKLVSEGGKVSMFSSEWSPKKFTIEESYTSNLALNMGVNIKDNVGDKVEILNLAQGVNNSLDLSNLYGQSGELAYDLTIASAPSGTSHDFFSFASFDRGFTVYTPNTQVTEQDGKVLWQLKGKKPAPPETEKPVPPETETPGTTQPGNGLFDGKDNKKLLKDARNMFASRQYLISNSSDRWEMIIDDATRNDNVWAMNTFRTGGYDGFTAKQHGLDLGIHKAQDSDYFWGAGIGFHKGDTSNSLFRDDYKMFSGNLYLGKDFESGLFVNAAVGYKHLSENFKVKGELNDLSGKVNTNLVTAGARVGYRMHSDELQASVSPSVSVNSSWMEGGKIHAKERQVDLHSGWAASVKAGVLADKSFENSKVTGGIYRNFSVKDMPGVTLSDSWKSRSYEAKKDDHFTATIGVEGKITEKMNANLKVSSHFGGDFKTDTVGILGLKYEF
ncbi:S6 family peptidase [Cronobacter turicensis]|uniref:S6 family peptidase n=1 Tax=Cronobacter turicensis TaxID=413502 RepID=UPI0024C2773C|nr:S6 family peptidase [Cronobacter turicensis]MDK1186944.1 S6 family peptidase [Cronobacter turicensis]MDK1207822.1 S6 family peptidase [Cronobacter turicensis]MDK1216759.1 S6 family peptidase [Cronobacter turicensis]MDK1220643.1 S6 family peptidase [Cronobacter turicensis]MDK1233855.1 S6 family peptidase [Cronobacter turicensis]